jgi:hypothetical protein
MSNIRILNQPAWPPPKPARHTYGRDPSIRLPDLSAYIDESKRFEAARLRSRPLPTRSEHKKPRVEPLYSCAGLLELAELSAFAGELAGDRA